METSSATADEAKQTVYSEEAWLSYFQDDTSQRAAGRRSCPGAVDIDSDPFLYSSSDSSIASRAVRCDGELLGHIYQVSYPDRFYSASLTIRRSTTTSYFRELGSNDVERMQGSGGVAILTPGQVLREASSLGFLMNDRRWSCTRGDEDSCLKAERRCVADAMTGMDGHIREGLPVFDQQSETDAPRITVWGMAFAHPTVTDLDHHFEDTNTMLESGRWSVPDGWVAPSQYTANTSQTDHALLALAYQYCSHAWSVPEGATRPCVDLDQPEIGVTCNKDTLPPERCLLHVERQTPACVALATN